jgi:adenylate cyclase
MQRVPYIRRAITRDMAQPAVTRRLRAIAVLDVAGYSRLMERDESGTHARVNEVFNQVVTPAVGACGGRIVDRAGDGLLLDFQSATDAVKCALEIQREMAVRNARVDPHQRIDLRIGVNVGDIIIDGDRIVGDGVNIAARMEAIAAAGSICISGSVREQLREDFGATITGIGDVRVKNIARPIRAFRISHDPPSAHRRLLALWRSNVHPAVSRWLVYVVVLGSLVAAVQYGLPILTGLGSTPAPAMSLVIVPFSAKDGGADQPAANVVTQEVTRGLAGTPWMQVTAPNVASKLTANAQNVSAIGRELNVRYLVFGWVQRRNGKLGVDAQLIDAAKGVSAWNEYVDSGKEASAESEIARHLVILLREAVYDAETKRLLSSGASPSTPMEYKIFGDNATDTRFVTLASDRAARKYYEGALKLDPNFVPALISVGYTLVTELDLDPAVAHDNVVQEIEELSKRAVAKDGASAPAWQFRSEALARQWRWDAALNASDNALALDPGRAFGFGHRASLMILLGRPTEALSFVDKAFALADQRLGFAMLQRCRAQMALGDYRAAITACQKSTSGEDWWMPHAYLAAAYALVGEDANAKDEKAALQRLYPDISIARITAIRYSNVPEFLRQIEDHLYRGLRKAGIADT